MPFNSNRYAENESGDKYRFDDIREGDVFRLFEADGSPLHGDERLYIATCDAWLDPIGVMRVDVKLYQE
jgi:hypothetical protein